MSLRDAPPAGGDPGVDARTADRDEATDERVLCAACDHAVARAGDAVAVAGAHEHTYANSQGYVYTVRLYARAAGCRLVGEPTAEATWFSGHAWQVALCGGCGEHLGWCWRAAAGAAFHGLVRQRIRLTG